jgi:hypothetical protein
MPTLFQKIRLAIRGWNRRREEANQAFVAKNQWSGSPSQTTAPEAGAATRAAIDMEGLVCAFLDDSGRIAYYLDTETGDVVDVRDSSELAPPRYRRVPTRSELSEAADRRAFAMKHQALLSSVGSAESFRNRLKGDRALERAWYNFKNDRAIAAIEQWLARK